VTNENENDNGTLVTERLADVQSGYDKIAAQIKERIDAGEPFDDLIASGSELLVKIKTAKTSENAEKINEAKDSIIAVLTATLNSTGLAELIGERVIKIEWRIDNVGETDDNDVSKEINVVRVNGKAKAGSSSKSTGGTGKRRNLKGYFEKYGTPEDEVRLNDAVKASAAGEEFEGRNFKDKKSHAENYVRQTVWSREGAVGHEEFGG
jgi:hypothetical protein